MLRKMPITVTEFSTQDTFDDYRLTHLRPTEIIDLREQKQKRQNPLEKRRGRFP
jgi:hypothetical protein